MRISYQKCFYNWYLSVWVDVLQTLDCNVRLAELQQCYSALAARNSQRATAVSDAAELRMEKRCALQNCLCTDSMRT